MKEGYEIGMLGYDYKDYTENGRSRNHPGYF
ncbi:hypothetical protein RCO48_06890 [Peribacillus frigoritolerans]|nr:hypothetical protein [Peribacillus frigoritolerans]